MTPYNTEMVHPRWLAKLKADAQGYFWLPCEICGEHFAGFEWGETLMTSWATGRATCAKPSCREETLRRNAEWMDANQPPTIYYTREDS